MGTKTLAGLMTDDDTAVSEYETMSMKNDIEKAIKEQSTKYEGKESKELDQAYLETLQTAQEPRPCLMQSSSIWPRLKNVVLPRRTHTLIAQTDNTMISF